MESIQQEGSEPDRYYFIDFNWINSWLTFVTGKDQKTGKKVKRSEPPGPIDNSRVEHFLLSKRTDPGPKNDLYYSVEKNLFYFFVMMYGGGPAVVSNDMYRTYEARKDHAAIKRKTESQKRLQEEEDSRSYRSQNSAQRAQGNSQRQMQHLEDGIVGLHNNTFYCYMNACLQCLLPIEELRDHFIL